jgi:hypothetical protein
MNILQKIGKNIEREKLKRHKRKDKYWKLSATERIDYDNKLNRIQKNSYMPFTIIIMLVKVFFYLIVFSGVSLFFIERLDLFISTGLILVECFFSFLIFALIAEMLIIILSIISTERKLKELNKRFKL